MSDDFDKAMEALAPVVKKLATSHVNKDAIMAALAQLITNVGFIHRIDEKSLRELTDIIVRSTMERIKKATN